jgi:serine/threonine protein kinase
MPSTIPIIQPSDIEFIGGRPNLHSGMDGTVSIAKLNYNNVTTPSSLLSVAVKRFAIRNSHSISRFEREALILELQTLRNCVRPIAIVRTPPHYWLVLPYFSKGDLGKVSKQDERISLPLALCICLDAANALASVHSSGFVFRDFKSANLLVGDDYKAYLTDFGSVQSLEKGIEKEENEMGPTGGFHKRKFSCSSTNINLLHN